MSKIRLPVAAAISIVVSSLQFFGCTPHQQSSGVAVTLVHRGPDPPPHLTDQDGLYTMAIQSKDTVRIRNEYIQVDNLGSRLQELFRTHIERLLLVEVQGQVTFSDVVEVLRRGPSRVELQYCLLTKGSIPAPAEPALFMQGKHIYTQYFLPEKKRVCKRRLCP